MKLTIPNTFPNIVIHPKVWRFLGFGSCLLGFICYALSPSFHDLFGYWNSLKISFYSILTIFFSVMTLFVNKCPQFTRGFLLKAHVGFLVLMLTSLYSFYEDRGSSKPGQDDKGRRHGNLLSLVSFGAFAFMSVCLSKQIQPEFDAGMSNFFLGCLIVAIMKMNIKIALGVAALFYVLITVHSFWDSQTGLPSLDDTGREIMAQLNEMQISANTGHEEAQLIGVSESRIEIPSLAIEGHKELDPMGKETPYNNIDELEIWFKASPAPASFSSPL